MTSLLDMSHQPKIIQSTDFISSMLDVVEPGKVLLITSKGFSKRGVTQKIQNVLGAQNVVVHDQITPNPELTDIQLWAESLVLERFSNIVVIGGGSAIDTAKVFSRLLVEPGLLLSSMLSAPTSDLKKGIRLIAIPTTSGTGAEVTPFATVWDSAEQKKYSLTQVAPDVAILDPSLTLTLGYQDTLYPALDALSHALESLWNKNRTAQSERFATEAIDKICAALPLVLNDVDNLAARKTMQKAATLAGLAISHTRTAIAHAISYPLTARYSVPHGLACSFTLASIIREFGAERLGLPDKLVDKVVAVLDQLDLAQELRKFIQENDLNRISRLPLDPSRADNFLPPLTPVMLSHIIRSSI